LHEVTQNIYNALDELALQYGVSRDEAEEALLNAIEKVYKGDEVFLKGDGVVVDGKYYTFSKKRYSELIDALKNEIIELSSLKIKYFILNVLKESDYTLYCKVSSKDNRFYYLTPFIKKDKPLSFLRIKVPVENFELNSDIHFFPVFIKEWLKRVKINLYEAQGCVICKKSVRYHIERYIKPKLGVLLEGKEIKVKNVFVKKEERMKRVIVLKIKGKVTNNIISYIKRYFNSFGWEVIFR